jgi:sugar fermentation stimulation protein A
MQITPPFLPAVFETRYKRFFADLRDADGNRLTVHCPNTGSMKNCLVPGSTCFYSLSNNPKRKLPGTLELVTTSEGQLAGVNTARANHLVHEAIESDLIDELRGYAQMRSEVRYGNEKSRIDLLLEDPQRGQCYIEVKNVTLEEAGGRVMFPDAVTSRGTKHLRELMAMLQQGHRAVLFFCVQVSDAKSMEIATEIDPTYAQTLSRAIDEGLEVMAWRAKLSPEEISLDCAIPFIQARQAPELSD